MKNGSQTRQGKTYQNKDTEVEESEWSLFGYICKKQKTPSLWLTFVIFSLQEGWMKTSEIRIQILNNVLILYQLHNK